LLQIEINVLLFELALTFYFIAAITGIAELFRGKKAGKRHHRGQRSTSRS